MTGTDTFLDTNVLLYLLSEDETKADRAEAILKVGGTISVQVLNELASVASRKLAMEWSEIRDILGTIRAATRVVPLDVHTHERALSLAERYRYSIYDSLIIASALGAQCSLLLSEDLQDGQRIGGHLTIRNPFRAEETGTADQGRNVNPPPGAPAG